MQLETCMAWVYNLNLPKDSLDEIIHALHKRIRELGELEGVIIEWKR